jgi:CheY-like chemotaxis protein
VQKLTRAGPPFRVLVTDANVVNQRVVVRMIEDLGMRADVAGNGCKTFEMLRLMHYDIVLMDCAMPVMNGYEAAGEIRRREHPGHRTFIVAMTTGAEGCHQKCLECGMDDFILKPVRLQALTEALRNWAPVKENEPLVAACAS